MIKNLRFLCCSVLMMLCGIVMADEISSNFTDKNMSVGVGELLWTPSINANSFESSSLARGVQFGAGKGEFTLTSDSALTSIKMVTMTVSTNASADKNTISVKVGETAFGEEYKMKKDNNYEISFKNVTGADGLITISVNDVEKSVYIKSIKVLYGNATVDPDDGGGNTPTIQQLTVAQALAIIDNLENGGKTAVEYAVEGYIVGTPEFQRNGSNILYGNVNLNMADEVGGTTTIAVYRGNSFNGEKFDEETIKLVNEGDKVIFQGILQKFAKDNVVTPQISSGSKLIMHNGQDHFDVQAAELTTAASVNDFLALTAGTEATLTLTNAQVTYVNVNNNKTDIFIREGNAAIDLFDLGIEAKVGYILNGTINVKLGANSGFVAAVKGTNELNSTIQVTDSAQVKPLEFTDFTEATDYYCHLLIATNVTVNDKGNILDGDQVELTIYDRFKNGLQDKLKKHKDDGKTFNVTGLMYNGGDTYGPELVIVDATFADGSEITDKPIELIGNGTKENPYLISDLLQLNTTILDQYSDSVWVKGIIVGAINGAKQNAIVDTIPSNLAIAAEAGIAEFAKVIPVELKNNSIFRTNLNVKDNATNIGKEIMLFGLIQSYFSTVGIKGVSDYILDGVQYSLNVTELKAQNRYNGAIYNLRGQRVTTPGKGLYIKNGKKYFVK